MKHWMLFLFLVLGSARAFPQQGYFIYLQTDNHQPFYIRMGEKVYSSTASGYVIIPQLADTSWQLIAGFPGNAFPEQYFNIELHHKDAGYVLKNFGDKGWGLFNLQSMAVIMSGNSSPEKKSPEVSVTKKTDAFSTLLANAVNDTSILYTTKLIEPTPEKPIVKKEPSPDTTTTANTTTYPVPANPATDTSITVKTAPPAVDTALVTKIQQAETNHPGKTDTLPPVPATPVDKVIKDSMAAIVASPASKTATPPAPVEKTNTLKVAELLTDTSYIAVYTDGTTDKYDTVRISIPLDKPGVLIQETPRKTRQPEYNMPDTAITTQTKAAAPKETAQLQKDTARKDTAQTVIASSAKTEPPKTIPQELRLPTEEQQKPDLPRRDSIAKRDSLQPADTLRTQETATKPAIPNSDCKNLAWDSDIDKLRIKMLAAKTDDDRIMLARKLFKQKCVTVKQVKALSELFNSDEGKYKWFDVSYPSVSDTANFSQLGELIKDNYYQSRFKAMLRH